MQAEVVKPEDVPANLQLINAPEWYVSGAQVIWAGNDPIILFNKIIPAAAPPSPPPDAPQDAPHLALGFVAPIGMVRMSAETFKELAIALHTTVTMREKDTGKVIETDAMRQQAAARQKG